MLWGRLLVVALVSTPTLMTKTAVVVETNVLAGKSVLLVNVDVWAVKPIGLESASILLAAVPTVVPAETLVPVVKSVLLVSVSSTVPPVSRLVATPVSTSSLTTTIVELAVLAVLARKSA